MLTVRADHPTARWREFAADRQRRTKSVHKKQHRGGSHEKKEEVWKTYLRALTSPSTDEKVFSGKLPRQTDPAPFVRPVMESPLLGSGKEGFSDARRPGAASAKRADRETRGDATPGARSAVTRGAQSGDQMLKRLAQVVASRAAENSGKPDGLAEDLWTRKSYRDERVGRILGYRPGLTAITEEDDQELPCSQSKEQRISMLREEISGLWSRLQGIENELNLARSKLSGFKGNGRS